MDRNLIDYLPPVLKTVREMKAVMDSGEQTEFSGLWDSVDAAFDDQFVTDATENGVLRWERILDIKPKASDGMGARKFRILTRLNESLPYTITVLRQMLEALCGKDGYSAELENDIYALYVKVGLAAKSNYDDIAALLKRVVPANIVIDLALKYNQHSTLAKFTHAELRRYTHLQLRTEETKHA